MTLRRILERVVLATAMTVLVVNVWTGAPLLALWIGSRVQLTSQPTMLAIVVVAVSLALLSLLLLRALRAISARYDRLTGTRSTTRTHLPWLRSMRGERPQYHGVRATLSMSERIVVVAVVAVFAALEIWFFFFSGSPIDAGSGRAAAPSKNAGMATASPRWIRSSS